MSSSKAEGIEEAVPMYSIQADMDISDLPVLPTNNNVQPYFPYKMGTTNINPCSEGLEDPVLINNDDCDVNEGVDNNDNNEIRVERGNRSDAPGCCRRYSCCFPLIIITLVWLMMISAEAFEHCQDCKSSISEYQCFDSEQRADFYCKSDKIQICCYYTSDDCRIIDYPKELDYKMGQYFSLSMIIVIITCLVPCLLPIGVPIMLYNDCRNNKFSKKRQKYFDIFCTFCFIVSSIGCSWTIFEYYKYPQNRCSTNSDLFGISTDDNNDSIQPNIWIMSQTTYCSFFSLILLSSFSICGIITLILQSIAKKKKKAAMIAQPDDAQKD